MVTYDRTPEREPTVASPIKICVAGVGGAGLNVLDRISLDRMVDASLVSMHTDVRVLTQAMASVKIQLGADMMRGIGSGGDPELGREAAVASQAQIRAALQGHDMVFICAGLGGGTGSGAAPVVAEIAKECGAMVFIFATMPFAFEGRRRLRQAEQCLEELKRCSDALILFENNRMGELTLPKEGIQKAFSQADQLIGHSVRAISSIVTQPGIVRMSMADLMTALRSTNSRCLFGFGEARGANRVTEALKRALKSPLVNQGLLLQNSKNLMVHVSGGESLALSEVEVLMKNLGKYVPEETQILFGLSVDPKLGDTLALTLLSSLSVQDMASESAVQAFEKLAAPGATQTSLAGPKIVEQELPAVVASLNHAVQPPPIPVAVVPAPVAQVAPVSKPISTPPPVAIADLFEPTEEPVAVAVAKVIPAPVAQIASIAPSAELFVAPIQYVAPVAISAPAPAPAPAPIPVQEPVYVAPVVIQQVAPVVVAPVVEAPVVVVEPTPIVEFAPAPVVAETPVIKTSVFAMVDDEDDFEEEEEQAPAYVAPVAPPVQKTILSSVIESTKTVTEIVQSPNREPESILARTIAKQPIERRREPEPETSFINSAPAKNTPKSSYEQSTLKLSQEEIARFKGTDKTIVEGVDLDVPTWMRMRGKVKV